LFPDQLPGARQVIARQSTEDFAEDAGLLDRLLDLRILDQLLRASKLSDVVESSVGNLVDADLAKESAKLQALQVKQQLGIQALSIANQAPQAIMSLFR
jgi:hypothetical protein